MKRVLLGLCLVGLFAAPAAAQSGATIKLAFDYDAVASLDELKSFGIKLFDGVNVVSGVTWECTGEAKPFTCASGDVVLAPGIHKLAVSVSNSLGDSAKSNTLTIGPPGAPGNLRQTFSSMSLTQNGNVISVTIAEPLLASR